MRKPEREFVTISKDALLAVWFGNYLAYSGRLPALSSLRFTPPGHDCTLIGPGRGRRSTWIDLVCNDSFGFERYYAAAEELMKEIGGRPHLGKFCENFKKADLMKVHGDHLVRFLELVAEHDPEGKFFNAFTRRLWQD